MNKKIVLIVTAAIVCVIFTITSETPVEKNPAKVLMPNEKASPKAQPRIGSTPAIKTSKPQVNEVVKVKPGIAPTNASKDQLDTKREAPASSPQILKSKLYNKNKKIGDIKITQINSILTVEDIRQFKHFPNLKKLSVGRGMEVTNELLDVLGEVKRDMGLYNPISFCLTNYEDDPQSIGERIKAIDAYNDAYPGTFDYWINVRKQVDDKVIKALYNARTPINLITFHDKNTTDKDIAFLSNLHVNVENYTFFRTKVTEAGIAKLKEKNPDVVVKVHE